MPTPMPIIEAISGDTEGTSVTPAITVTRPSPTKMPNMAEPIGIPAAITEPNATSSTTTATSEPDRLAAAFVLRAADDLA